MKNERILSNILVVGQDAIQSLTILAAHIQSLDDRETDAELVSGAARDIAGVVLGLIDQMIPDSEVMHS